MDTEPDVKKKKALPRISSLSTMLATPLGRRVEKMGSALQKSLSVARLSPAGSMRTPSKASLARSASTVFGEKEEDGRLDEAPRRLRRRTKCLMMGCGGQLPPIM